MTDTLPLTALRAFETAARTGSVRRAADALHVTPSAISHQLRALEDTLGVALFRRANRRLILTEAGQVLLPGLTDGFDRLGDAVAALSAFQRRGVLTVSMLSTFAVRWFIPRLTRFQKLHTDIEVRVSTTMRTVDFAREGIDAAIRYGHGDWPCVRSDRLIDEDIVPVCAPALLEGDPPLSTPKDLKHHTLLTSDARPDEWAVWFGGVGLAGLQPARRIAFDATHFALDAALGGAGVAITARELVTDDLQRGRLVTPFTQAHRHTMGYYLVCPLDRADEPTMTTLRHWLLDEADRPAA